MNLRFILILLIVFQSENEVLTQDGGPRILQAPVCAPVLGTNHQGGLIQGSKGERGFPGKRGPQGQKGERGLSGRSLDLGGCPVIKYHFPRELQTEDYVRYRSYFPAMKETTICAWLELPPTVDEEWFLSYAVTSQANEILVGFRDTKNIGFWAGGTDSNILIPSVASLKQLQICVWFSSQRNKRGVYINGEEAATISTSTNPVRGGGDLVVGQEQDATDAGDLVAEESYTGNITNLMIWPRVLAGKEVANMAQRCECPNDFAIVTTLDRTELHGEATYSIPDICPTL